MLTDQERNDLAMIALVAREWRDKPTPDGAADLIAIYERRRPDWLRARVNAEVMCQHGSHSRAQAILDAVERILREAAP